MQYRKFGRLDWQGSALGFGCMRLPVIDGDNGKIDEPEAIRMIRHAIDQGVNYVDTAYGYHNHTSELVVGKALGEGYRDRVRLATKLPVWLVKEASDFDRLLNEQRQKLQTDHIDFYLLHALHANTWHTVRDLGVLDWARGALRDGRIGHLGFSFHDKLEVFKEIVDAAPDLWSFCQIQYNYLDIEEQAGTEGLQYAAARGLAVVIMEPLRGGRLVNPPAEIQALWDTAPVKRSPADWALQWLWNQPEVSVVLSGMSTMEQVEQNLASASRSGVGTLSADELALFDRVRTRYQELCPIPCTACNYCQPCPNGLPIPRLFGMYNQGRMFNDLDGSRSEYGRLKPEERADACAKCRECESNCPQHIAIADWMDNVHAVLGEGKDYSACPAF